MSDSIFIRTLSICLVAIAVIASSTALAQRGGGGSRREGGFSGSGGGGGVICFADSTQALRADEHLNQRHVLPDDILALGRIQLLEEWELELQNDRTRTPDAGEMWPSILSKVENILRNDFPVFMFRFDQAGDWSQLQTWTDDENLGLLEDAEPIFPLPANCRRIQIALRFSNGNNVRGEGPTVHRPEVKVHFVKKYFDRLSETAKAMLVFHEKLYMMGQAIGHPTSDVVRAFVRIFFGSGSRNRIGQPGLIRLSPGERMIKDNLIQYFGDYIRYFSADIPVLDGPFFSSQRHFKTFFELLARLRDRTCDHLPRSSPACLQQIMNPLRLENELSPEEAFLYYVFFGLERGFGRINADQIMDPHARDPRNYESAMRISCEEVSGGSLGHRMIARQMIAKARAYCRAYHDSL